MSIILNCISLITSRAGNLHMSFGYLDSIHEVYIQVIHFSMGFSIFFTDVGLLYGVWALSVFVFFFYVWLRWVFVSAGLSSGCSERGCSLVVVHRL